MGAEGEELLDSVHRERQVPGVPKTVTLIGAGGIGAPAAMALCEAGLENLLLVDQDRVELSNLHRQILFEDEDVGRDKGEAFQRALAERYPEVGIRRIDDRATPDNVLDLARASDVIIDATDNFASRFLLADAAHLAEVPIVHAAAVRWRATVMAVGATGSPCYRCLFEDIPTGFAIDCATAGVAGPVCGVSGAVAADRAIRLLAGDVTCVAHILTYDGLTDRMRQVPLSRRADCVLCGDSPTIGSIVANRYMSEVCGTD